MLIYVSTYNKIVFLFNKFFFFFFCNLITFYWSVFKRMALLPTLNYNESLKSLKLLNKTVQFKSLNWKYSK